MDSTTSEVVRWLYHLGEENVIRVNYDDEFEHNLHISLSDKTGRLNFAGNTFSLDDVKAVWYRKGLFWFRNLFPAHEINGHPSLTATLTTISERENNKVREYFHYLLRKKSRILGSSSNATLNKLITLNLAREAGLHIPGFLVSNDRDEILARSQDGTSYITKSISDGVYLFDSADSCNGYFSYTEQLDPAALNGLPKRIAPSLIQQEIRKSFEVRTFFLDGDFYSVAIFSQLDTQTRVDYRKYNDNVPNRNVPYQLPPDVADKLKTLFAALDLNTGSVDLMVDAQGVHWFLEINPVGQFENMLEMCNYQLSKKVALWLMGRNE